MNKFLNLIFFLIGLFAVNNLSAETKENKNPENRNLINMVGINSFNVIKSSMLTSFNCSNTADTMSNYMFNVFYGKQITENLTLKIPFSVLFKFITERNSVSDQELIVPFAGMSVGLLTRLQWQYPIFNNDLFVEIGGQYVILKTTHKYSAVYIAKIVELIFGISFEIIPELLYSEIGLKGKCNDFNRVYHTQRKSKDKFCCYDYQLSIFLQF